MRLAWSPVERDKFLTYTNSVITLFETKSFDREEPIPKGSTQLSDDLYSTSIATLSDVHLVKCVAWYPAVTQDPLIAVGQAYGKILLSNFSKRGNSDLAGKEFVPKHLRHCSYLYWNPIHCHLLAEGLDKHRNDSCICIWDVRSNSSTELSFERRYSSNMAENSTKPFLDFGMGETTTSFSWFSKEPGTFVSGMNGKCLRVYDLRDPSKAQLVAHTKYVHDVCADPLHESRIASYSESHVSIWDVRNFDKPQLTLPTDRPVMKIDWCPTRTGFLGVLCRDSSVLKLYDIRHSVIGADDLEPFTFERSIQPSRQQQNVSNFVWHPTCENRLMSVTSNGTLKDNQIFEKLPMSVSPSMNLVSVFGRKVSIFDFGSEVDMASHIKQRALKGYGLHSEDLWNNAVVVTDEPHLHALWHWLDLCRAIPSSCVEPAGRRPGAKSISQYVGVLDQLALDAQGQPSETNYTQWQYPKDTRSNNHERSHMFQYKSEARSRALQLCGWWYDSKNKGDPSSLLDSLVKDNLEYERAAAIALFHLKIGKAVEILSSEEAQAIENGMLNTVAMALSGFTDERNALWRKTCINLRQKLRNPYLRAMFAFLASDRDSYEEVLNDDPQMAVKDRVAFACLYLNDNKLNLYLKDLSRSLKQTGNLDGILLTGLVGEEGLELLGNYVDATSDVQTASLAVIYSAPSVLTKDERVITWMEGYRELLDRWQLWHQRAKFDIIRQKLDNVRVHGQAFVSCNFCGKSIACNMALASRSRQSNYSMLPPTNKPKVTCCPGCRKPLPRCTLCMTNLGTPSGSGLGQQKNKTEFEGKLSPFDSWFTWCQSCRHGGHSSHITSWFQQHVECPVTGCQCRCMSVDPASLLAAETSHLNSHFFDET